MKVIQINALYGSKSTGTIMRNIQECSQKNGIEGYVAYSYADRQFDNINNGYQIGNKLTAKLHATLSRIGGKQAYYSYFTTKRFLRYLDKIKPDIVHLHNLHNNYIKLNMLLDYLAQKDIITVITMHDCWYFTGGCTHYTSTGCNKWLSGCGDCPWPKSESKAYIYDASKLIYDDRNKYLNAIPHLVMVGCSKWIALECGRSFLRGRDIRYIHNGFDLNVFHPRTSNLRKELGIVDKYVILGPAIKWLLPINKKTFDYFTANMPKDTILVLFGCPRHFDNLPGNVLQYGYTTSPERMAELYSMADIMVNCSREDTLSSLNLESQACGTPVVTYDATGSEETVNGICGYAVQTGNYKMLLDYVLKIRNIGKFKLESQCISWIAANFEKNRSYQKYIELYKELYYKK